ncbi:MAG TPA: uracil-DNA glycosylase [Tepidisphaeraceae bacterium]|nr:uracil-DNA glycosylase [Tepidisphaeraceae bacterium]
MARRRSLSQWEALNERIVTCERCPRLRAHCLETARVKRAAFRDQEYWGRPIPNWGPADPATARLLIVGLAPAAHGGNRTGRVFTGDRSGDFLFRAMYETGFATAPTSTHAGDGTELVGCAITATAHCAPPGNKPTPEEIVACRSFLDETAAALSGLRGVMALGKIGWDASVRLMARVGRPVARGAAFGHGAVAWSDKNGAGGPWFLIGAYHPSQQNTFTGKLTPAMLRGVFETARGLIGEGARATRGGEQGM